MPGRPPIGEVASRPEWVTVLIEESEPENWGVAGELLPDAFGRKDEK